MCDCDANAGDCGICVTVLKRTPLSKICMYMYRAIMLQELYKVDGGKEERVTLSPKTFDG
jgi:hypothetical protein